MKNKRSFEVFVLGMRMTFDMFGYFGTAAGNEQLRASRRKRRELVEYATSKSDSPVQERIGSYWRKVGGHIENAMTQSSQ